MQRHFESKRFGGPEVDHELKLDRRLDRKLARLRALENAIGIGRRAPKIVDLIIPVGEQTAEFSEETIWIDGRQPITGSQGCDLLSMRDQKNIRHHGDATIWLACHSGQSGIELGPVLNRCCSGLNCERRSGRFERIEERLGVWCRYRVEQQCDPIYARSNLLNSSSHLPAWEISTLVKPVTLPPGRAKLATKPLPIGSDTVAKRIGMVRVCCSKIAVSGVFCERIRSGCWETTSSAIRCIEAISGVAQRVSIRRLWPSVHPSFWSPSRKAAA